MGAWVERWGYTIATKPTRPGIWRLKTGGFLVRVRANDPRSGRRVSKTRALPAARAVSEAQIERDRLHVELRAEARGERPLTTTFSAFAVSLLEQKILRGKLKSQATREWWRDALKVLIPAFGSIDITALRKQDIDHWLATQVARWMREGRPTLRKRRVKGKLVEVETRRAPGARTINGWLRVLRVICHAAHDDYDLHRSAFDGIEFFDEGRAHTRESPNALPPDVVPLFLAKARELVPQHYAMILLGIVTGWRPSSLRPLRRKGPGCDIDWTTGVVLLRRSHSRKQTVMDSTKTGRDQDVALPPDVLAVLQAHADALPEGPMMASDLLFPARHGGFQTRTILTKPFARICEALSDRLGFRVTPRSMRRTFNDLARTVGVHDVVTRSVSGHVTETMQRHYSTAQHDEQRRGLGRVFAAVSMPLQAVPKGETEGESDVDE
jgi:integrase